MISNHIYLSKSSVFQPSQHRLYQVIKHYETSTIVKDKISLKEFTCKKIYVPLFDDVILYIESISSNDNPFFDYSILNDYIEDNTYIFDIVEKREKGFLIENNEDIQLFVPAFLEGKISNNRISLTVDKFSLDRNQIFWKTENPHNTFPNTTDLRKVFKKNHRYDFIITGYESINENISIFHVERDGAIASVKAHDFQDESMIGDTIKCLVIVVWFNRLKLIQDKKSILKSFYKEDQLYPFKVISLEKEELTNYYILEGNQGFTHRLYLNNITESLDYNIGEEQQQMFFLKGIKDNGDLILKLPDDPQNRFYDVESIFSDIGFENKIQPFFYDLKERLEEDIYDERTYSNLFDLYEAKENTWIFSYLNYTSQSYLKTLIKEGHPNDAYELLNLIISLEEWILEDSDYLSNFGEYKQARIIEMAEKELEQAEYKKEAINKIRNNEHLQYIDEIAGKISLSKNLRTKSILIFKELLLFSDELIKQNTLKVISIVKFLIENKELQEFEYKKFNNVLNYKIKSEKHQLNNKLRSRNYQINEEDKTDIKQIVEILLVQIVLDLKIDNKKNWILNSCALFRFSSYLETDIDKKQLLLLHASDCITKSEGLTFENLNSFDIQKHVTHRKLNIISENQKSNFHERFYVAEGLICKSNLGFHLINARHYKLNENINSYRSIASYLNNSIFISTGLYANFELTQLNNITEYKKAWNSFYYFDENDSIEDHSNNLIIGDIVKVQAKNYLKNNDKVVFLKIISNDKSGEGILSIGEFNSSHIEGFSGIINPGDIFDAEILDINKKGISFSTKNILRKSHKNRYENDERVDAIISHRSGNQLHFFTIDGVGGTSYSIHNAGYNIGDVLNVTVREFNVKYGNYDFEINSPSNKTFSIKEVARRSFEQNLMDLEISNLYENEKDLDNNRIYIEELIICLEALASLETDQKIRLEFYYLLKFLASIVKSSKSYYFDALIRHIETLDKFKHLKAGEILDELPLPNPTTLENFKYLTHLYKSYTLLGSLNNLDKTQALINLNDVDDYDPILNEVKELIIANNLFLKNGISSEVMLTKTKNLIYEKITKEEIESPLEISDIETLTLDEILELEEISLGRENTTIEFKTSIFYYAGSSSVNKTEQGFIIMKTIAGLLNAEGGSLFIGVNDSGFPIGLEEDYKIINGGYDEYERYLRRLIVDHFNKDINGQIKFKFSELNNKEYLEISIQEYESPVSLKDEFYQRQGNETRILKGEDLLRFFKRKNILKLENPSYKLKDSPNVLEAERQTNLFDFYEDQKHQSGTVNTESLKKTNEIAFIYFLKGNKYFVSNKEYKGTRDVEYKIPIKKEDRKKHLIQGYDNGCVNKLKVRTILDKNFDYEYSNSMFSDAAIKIIQLVDDTDLIRISTIKDRSEFTKLYEVRNISEHQHFHLKGNNLVQDTFDSLKTIEVINAKHMRSLSRLIYKSRQTLGKNKNNSSFRNEFDYLENVSHL